MTKVFFKLQAKSLSEEWAARADLPPHVVQLLNDFPSELHPMSQLSAAVTAMNSESHFVKAYSDGVKKSEFWEVLKMSFFVIRKNAFVIRI